MAHAHHHHRHHDYTEKDPRHIPQTSMDALHSAMSLEGAPAAWFDDLLWIMAQESEGIPGRINPARTHAAGLFQIAEVNYNLFPRGRSSIGDPTDECRAGIRYVVQRYHTASAARDFWKTHHWY